MIRYDDSEKKWALETGHSALVLALSPDGLLLVTWFGPRLPAVSDYPRASAEMPWASFGPGESLSPEFFPAWGGARYAEPCIKAEYPDGVRDARLEFSSFSIDGEELVISMADPCYPLRVDVSVRAYPECDLFSQSARIRWEGEGSVKIEEALSGVLFARRGPPYRLTHLVGRWAGETQPERTMLPEAKVTLESRRGFTSHSANPFFALDPEGSSDEERGEVYFGELAWSGNWKVAIERDNFGLTRASAGINDFDFASEVCAGRDLATPALVFGYTDGGFGQMSRNLHAYQRVHLASPARSGKRRKILYNSWEATYFAVDEAGQKKLAELAASIGVELFVMDDGWFGRRNDDRSSLGDWFVSPDKFPGGLAGLVSHVKSLGMDFGLWVEPEMVSPDSDLYRAHPDWVYHVPGRPRTEQRNQLVLNLARPDVQEFVLSFMDRLLSENDISFIKWDLNRNITEFGYPPDHPRDVVREHVLALYRIVGELRSRHPGVMFQSCSGGGGRVDPGILAYFDQVWPSDNTDAADRLRIQEGFSYAYGAHLMEAWVTAGRNWLTGRELPLEFRFHSSMAGTLGIGEDLAKWGAEELETARSMIALYKEIRETVQEGDLYRLLSPLDSGASALMYVSAGKEKAVLFAFSCNGHFGRPMPTVYPRGLDPVARYRSETPAGPIEMSGAAFMARGVNIPLRGDYASAIIRFARVTSA